MPMPKHLQECKDRMRAERMAFIDVALAHDSPDCLLWPFGMTKKGYPVIGYRLMAHSYVCEKTHGPRPSASHVAGHDCGNSACVSAKHIRWKSAAENRADRWIHGTHRAGTQSPHSKLTAEEVREIRNSKQWAVFQRRFGISRSTIWKIRRGMTYKETSPAQLYHQATTK